MAKHEAGDRTIVAEFHELVNMTPAALERWLASDESREVGVRPKAGRESIGHASGRRIVEMLRKGRRAYEASDLKHMHKVVGYIKRHLAQRPHGDSTHSRWAYSLKNWGHDPNRRPRVA